jgi:phage baseplate assembly protein W
MARSTRTFSDLDLNFTAHPVTGDIARRFDDNAIKTALKNLILTNNYERPFHSEIGTPIKGILFEPYSPMMTTMIERAIYSTVNTFEPRVNLDNVIVKAAPDENYVTVTLYYRILNTQRPATLELVLERTR